MLIGQIDIQPEGNYRKSSTANRLEEGSWVGAMWYSLFRAGRLPKGISVRAGHLVHGLTARLICSLAQRSCVGRSSRCSEDEEEDRRQEHGRESRRQVTVMCLV